MYLFVCSFFLVEKKDDVFVKAGFGGVGGRGGLANLVSNFNQPGDFIHATNKILGNLKLA